VTAAPSAEARSAPSGDVPRLSGRGATRHKSTRIRRLGDATVRALPRKGALSERRRAAQPVHDLPDPPQRVVSRGRGHRPHRWPGQRRPWTRCPETLGVRSRHGAECVSRTRAAGHPPTRRRTDRRRGGPRFVEQPGPGLRVQPDLVRWSGIVRPSRLPAPRGRPALAPSASGGFAERGEPASRTGSSAVADRGTAGLVCPTRLRRSRSRCLRSGGVVDGGIPASTGDSPRRWSQKVQPAGARGSGK
jgi:hypothetical protein